MSSHHILPIIAGGFMAVIVLLYVIFDGLDLGVGIMFAAERDRTSRNLMIQSFTPIWDGNETWLVLGAASMTATFPVAISVLLPALYIPIIAMLMGLIFRGVAVEFRERAPTRRQRHLWDAGFLGGSVLAAFCQGALLGAVMQGIKIVPGPFGGRFGGYPFSWLSWFSIYTGIALVFGYGLLGATWLIWRTEGDLQNRMRRWAAILCVVQLAFMVGVSFWTPFLNHHYMHRWFTWPAAIVTTLAPFGVLGAVTLFYFFLWKRRADPKYDMMPFLCAGALFVIAYAGVGFSLYPIILPPSLTIWNASSPPMTEEFILIGDAIFIPILLGYNTFAWWIFRGKARDEPFGD